MMNRFPRAACTALALPWLLSAALAQTQTWPLKPVRFVVGYAPGGVADITACMIAQKLSTALGQQVIVDNKPSAGGIVAADIVAKADPDGSTLLHLNQGNAVSAVIFKRLPCDTARDYAPVSAMGFFDVLVNLRDLPVSEIAKWKQVVETTGIEKQ